MKKTQLLPSRLTKTLQEILSVPTTSFHEGWLSALLVKRISRLPQVTLKSDSIGNLHIRFRGSTAKKPRFCLQAHMDHPGFARTKHCRSSSEAEAFGGVPQNCKGATIRFFTSATDPGVRATVTENPFQREGKTFISFKCSREVPLHAVAMWDFPILKSKGEWLLGRAFDDTLSVGILVALLEKASVEKWKVAFDALFTRAEEVGFVGTLELLRRKSFSLPETIVTLEVPRASGELVAGNGVMLRAGDRRFCFDPDLLLHFEVLAEKLRGDVPHFKAQRRLGLAGGIESSCFQLAGYRVGSLCVAVEEGHNIDLRNGGRPAPERAHVTDVLSLVTFLERFLREKDSLASIKKQVATQLNKNAAHWRSYL